MMFLLIIGGSFMPLMSSEIKHASMDMDEQQAWYAAEAGIKFAKAYANDVDTIKESIGQKLKVISDNDSVQYVLKIVDPKDSSAVTSTSLKPDKRYMVYSEGIFNGVKKVITEEMVFVKGNGSGGNNGGDNGGGTSGDISSVENSFISAGGRITIVDKDMKFSVSDDKTIMQSSQLIFPQRTQQWYDDSTYEKSAAKSNWWNKNTNLASSLYTYLPSSMFAVSSGTSQMFANDMNGWSINLATNEKGYIDNSSFDTSNTNTINLSGQSGSMLYVKSSAVGKTVINGITGPTSGEPMTIFWDGDLKLSGLSIINNVRILVSGKLTLANGRGTGNFMFMSNGDLTVEPNMSGMKNIFLSSNNNIYISGAFTGQLQAKNDIEIKGTGETVVFDSSVLKAFGLPKGVTT